ncbi:MAG TPA: HEAT repeat domain-containing protein [Vicinamibacterales bacterium]|jgi:HEAT repeat protein|nr:HEAT repeat domain-containing protein [Vicinamibacterales bacterium]
MKRFSPLVVLLLALPTSTLAQPPAQQDPAVAQLARAWTAFADGRLDEAIQLSSQIAAGDGPLTHDAVALQVRVEASRERVDQALTAYEQWLKRSGHEDRFLLHPAAQRLLLTLSRSSDAGVRAAAVARLLRSGVTQVPAVSDQSDMSITARAEGGDKTAQQQLAQMVESEALPVRLVTVNALAAGGSASVPVLIKLLSNRAPEVRGAAAEALGDIGGTDAIQALRSARQDPDPFVRLKVSVELARAGDQEALTAVNTALRSEVGDVRVVAADAFRDNPTEASIAALQSALSDPNPLTRAHAAALLGNTDEGTGTLTELINGENPTVRGEAARAVEDRAANNLPVIRSMLRSSDPWVQLYGAGALLRARPR